MSSTPRVLVVDDNPINQKVVAGLLNQVPLACDLANDGLAALTACRRTRYALVVMDCQMPRMDGWAATRAIRALERTSGGRVPIVAVTAQALAGDRQRCLDAGMDEYLTKPVDGAKLLALARRFIQFEPVPQVEAPPVAAPPAEAPPTADHPDILDEEVVQRLHSLGQDTFCEVYREFLGEIPLRLERVGQQLAAGDAPALVAGFHGLKGVAGTLGARCLAQLSGELDHCARAGDLPRIRSRLDELHLLCQTTVERIRPLIANQSG